MKVLSVVLLSASLIILVAAAPVKEHYDLDKADQLFEDFIKTYHRSYKDEHDKQVHFEAFKESLKIINEANAKSDTATFGINDFADYTNEEKKGMFGAKLPGKQ